MCGGFRKAKNCFDGCTKGYNKGGGKTKDKENGAEGCHSYFVAVVLFAHAFDFNGFSCRLGVYFAQKSCLFVYSIKLSIKFN